MNIHEWAQRWGISDNAMYELFVGCGCYDPVDPDHTGKSESGISDMQRVTAARAGTILWRNNVGAVMTEDGRMVRFGLCNDSKKLNEKIKSSDLVGIRPVLITPEMVGTTIGQFVARECKRPGWTYKATAREEAQLRFHILVSERGGDAAFASTPEFK